MFSPISRHGPAHEHFASRTGSPHPSLTAGSGIPTKGGMSPYHHHTTLRERFARLPLSGKLAVGALASGI